MAPKVYGDRWRIEGQLGEGGQAQTFIVVDLKGDSTTLFVLKRLKNVGRLARFRREVEVVQSLSHPNVIRLVDFDLEAERPYLVSEYCAGGNLAQYVAQNSLGAEEKLELFVQVCDGVAAAHQAGIVHRDIKPENVLLREVGGPAVVADFGICYLEDGERHTLTEEAVGPWRYMAPELEDGLLDEVRPASDVYSLGKLHYWLLGGRAFNREQHREDKYNLVRLLESPKLEHVNRLLDRMITREPDARLPNAAAAAIEVRNLARLLKGGYNPVSAKLPQQCTYCGQGTYQMVVWRKDPTAVRNFGFDAVGTADWRVLVCDQCGHVQLFRIENAQHKDWWDR